MTVFYHVQSGAIELPDGTVVEPRVAERLSAFVGSPEARLKNVLELDPFELSGDLSL
jgi:hypothetical protein